MMDLRLLGVGNMQTPFSQLQRRLFLYQMMGMVFSAITGIALVYAQPMRFYLNIFFWVKMVMMALAGLNALAFHYLTYNSVSRWDKDPILPPAARLAGASVWLCGSAWWCRGGSSPTTGSNRSHPCCPTSNG